MVFAQLFFVWLLCSSVSCQRFGTMRLNSVNCTHVTLTVNVDPQSSTFAFNWFLRINGSTTNINLALVGLNGMGTVGIVLQNNTYSGQYTISNNPEMLATTASPWDTSITFNLPAEATSFRFLVSTVTLEEMSPDVYSKPSCPLGNDSNCVDPANSETCPTLAYCGTSYNRICTDGQASTYFCPDTNADFSDNMLYQCLQPKCCINNNLLSSNELGCIIALPIIGCIGLIIGILLVFKSPSSPPSIFDFVDGRSGRKYESSFSYPPSDSIQRYHNELRVQFDGRINTQLTEPGSTLTSRNARKEKVSATLGKDAVLDNKLPYIDEDVGTEWFHNESPVKLDDGRISIKRTLGGSTLTIKNASESDAGEYTCVRTAHPNVKYEYELKLSSETESNSSRN